MIAKRHKLLTKVAADLMTRSVVLLPKEMSLPRAAHLLGQAQVTGAPVVDDEGHCIGVLSTTDFLHYVEHDRHSRLVAPHSVCSWQIMDEEDPKDRVADFMNTDPVTVAPTTGIGVLLRTMIDAHIHRVIVVDEWQRPIGIVSTTDILAAVAQAAAAAM